ncbi:hypothetical protein ACEPAI_6360 [Sanghuangporus weigelae]
MQSAIEIALDKLVSPRSPVSSQKDALTTLEHTLAECLLTDKRHLVQSELDVFLQLQDSFQCNLASRLLLWLGCRTETLMKLGDRRTNTSGDREEEFGEITTLVIQALSLLQGVALMHKPSKEFLCRRSSIEVFVDLLSICRHASARSFANLANASPTKSASNDYPWDPTLVSAVLDTLLCILVDAPTALRCFEEVKGIEHIVKVLKRPTIPKDVRIKCLEFLYFYLMDESTPLSDEVPVRPSSPVKRPRSTPFERSRVSTASSRSSNSSGSHSSSSSLGSWSPTPTLAGTPPLSPKKSAFSELSQAQDALGMLRKDVDFVPQSPQKVKVAQVDGGIRRPGTPQQSSPLKVPRVVHKQASPLSRLASEETLRPDSDIDSGVYDVRKTVSKTGPWKTSSVGCISSVQTRTMQEKKEILGQLLGNVDALVEGVKKAGIWG